VVFCLVISLLHWRCFFCLFLFFLPWSLIQRISISAH
jgi:hypothetical protein